MRDEERADEDVIGSEQITGRAEPLPEEAAVVQDGEDRTAAAAEVLRDSEERVRAASAGEAPGDAADQNRTSDETAQG